MTNPTTEINKTVKWSYRKGNKEPRTNTRKHYHLKNIKEMNNIRKTEVKHRDKNQERKCVCNQEKGNKILRIKKTK